MTRQAPAGPCERKIMTRPLAVGRGAILTSHDLFFAKNYDVIVFRERAGALLPIPQAGVRALAGSLFGARKTPCLFGLTFENISRHWGLGPAEAL